MKSAILLFLLSSLIINGQDIKSIQLFNPKTNDETPVINLVEQLILRFDDLENTSTVYRYTLKHLDRNFKDDGLFFTEYADGNMNSLLDKYEYSFNTMQKYTHYELPIPNENIRPKISGNYQLIVYKDRPENPVFTRTFSISENAAQLNLNVGRTADSRHPERNQRVEVQAVATNGLLAANTNSASLSVVQNNNFHTAKTNLRPTATLGNQLLFQQMDLSFPGNSEFFYFDNKNMDQPFDMVAGAENIDGINHTYLHPVWAYPENYQYQPDVNGAYYFRRNDLGTERDADTEGDYSWVYFNLESEKINDEIYVVGAFNNYLLSHENMMKYDDARKKYVAAIYLKQGFYNYLLAIKKAHGTISFGEINGNFWQTENLYQSYLYYRPFGKNYDALLGYGEFRKKMR